MKGNYFAKDVFPCFSYYHCALFCALVDNSQKPDVRRNIAKRSTMPVVPVYYLAVALSTAVFGAIFPQSGLRASSGLLINAYMLYWTRTALANSTEPVPHVTDYAVHGILVYFLLRWIDCFVLHTPEKDFYRIRYQKAGDRSVETREDIPTTLVGKLEWAFDLALSVRGEGWNFKIKNLPDGPSEKCSRT